MYRPTAEELSASISVPLEGFFDGADVAFTTPAPSATARGVPTEVPTPPSEPVPREKGTHTERVSETTLIPAKTPISPKGVIPTTAQIEATSLILPHVISTSDPFAALSQVMKDGSSLVITPSSIPSSTTCGPDADLSSEESKDILKDPEDEPVLKKRISNSNEEESTSLKTESMGMCFFVSFLHFFFLFYICIYVAPCCGLPFIRMPISLFAETFEGLRVVADVGVPSTAPPATPIVPIFTASYVSISVLPTAPIIVGPGEFPFPLSPFSFLLCMSVPFLDHNFSFHALCFLDRSTPYYSFSV